MNSQCIFINLPGKWQQEEQLIRCIFREPAIKQCGHKKFQHILLQNSQKPFQNVALNSTSQKDYSFPFVKCMSCESLTSKTVILKARCTNPMKIRIHNWNALKKNLLVMSTWQGILHFTSALWPSYNLLIAFSDFQLKLWAHK